MNMKQHTKSRKRGGWIAAVCLLLCIAVGVGAFVMWNPFGKDDTDDTSTPPTRITPLLSDYALDTTLTSVSALGNTLKIDCIEPGLDTYSAKVLLFDLASNTLLSETTLGEAAWMTGLTNNGFYAIDPTKKTVYLYDRTGRITFEKTFEQTADWSPVCGVSEDERQLVYATLPQSELHVYDLQSEEENRITSSESLCESLGFVDGKLYATTLSQSLAVIDPQTRSAHTAVTDRRLNTFTPHLCLGTTDYSFLAATEDAVRYVPFRRVDEVVVGVGSERFATSTCTENGDTVRVYDLAQHIVSELTLSDTVESVCFLSDGRFIAVTGDPMAKTHALYLCDPKAADSQTLQVNTTDTPQQGEPQIDIPAAIPQRTVVMVGDVPILSQFPAYPTGCESVSTVMVLQSLGKDIDTETFVDTYLPKSATFYSDGGKRYGPSPYEHFIGDPRTSASYGCMAPVIKAAIVAYLGSDKVTNTTGTDLSTLCDTYIRNGTPVLVWATINMLETNPKNSWYLADGTRFTWPGNEHCMVLVGYDDTHYYFNDPYAGKLVKYEKGLVEDRYAELGHQSLVVSE